LSSLENIYIGVIEEIVVTDVLSVNWQSITLEKDG
jgi:hypothetical protein